MNKEERRLFDKFYTRKEVANKCYENMKYYLSINNIKNFIFIEPSAGNGSFLDVIKEEKIGFDIKPEKNNIIQIDFIKDDISSYLKKNKTNIIIGNPPFGKNSSLAIKFLNKSFDYSNIVGFILPKTFKKESVKNRINMNFSCIFEEELGENSFLLGERLYNVPCVFQIWIKSETRKKTDKVECEYIEYTTKEKAKYAIRRVGVYSGKIFNSFDEYSKQSHYFINCEEYIYHIILKGYEELNKISKNTSGNPSLSKSELNIFINNIYKK